MEEEKIAIYLGIMNKLKDLKLMDPIEENPMLRGNIAFLIEQYYDREKWEEILNKIEELIKAKDVNELCMMITNLIYEKALPLQPKVENGDALLWLSYELNRELYEEKDLDTFILVNDSLYPEWIYKAEFILGYND